VFTLDDQRANGEWTVNVRAGHAVHNDVWNA
jgi:hypothetical protein